jgi:excisionase family DNA binding protein
MPSRRRVAAADGRRRQGQEGVSVMTATTGERLLITVEEAARRLGIGRSLAWRLVRSGELPSVRLGRLVRIPEQSLADWLKQRARGNE